MAKNSLDNMSQFEVSGPNPAEAAALSGASAVIQSGQEDDYSFSSDPEEGLVEETSEPISMAGSDEDLGYAPDTVPEASDSDSESVVFIEQPFQPIVTDDMSFSAAFAAARDAMGPGGSFVWHGRVYGTYYENEWNAMTRAEQHAFTQNAISEHHNELYHNEVHYAENVNEVDDINSPIDDSQITVLGMETLENGDEPMNLAHLEINGESVYMVDLDNDNVYDYAFGDFDHSGTTMDSPADIVDMSEVHMTTDDMLALMNGSEDSAGLDMAGDAFAGGEDLA